MNAISQIENLDLKSVVQKNSPLKQWLVDYVGKQIKPADGLITVEMIVDVVSKEFPEFLLAIAEENFIRGYEQANLDFEYDELERGNKKNKRRKK
jgi:hypothetical protein